MHMPHTPFLPLLSSIGPLGRRLLGLFAAVLALSLLGSAIGLWALQHIGVSTDDIVQRSIANERLVADAYRLQAINAERYKAVALSSEPEVGEILGADIAQTQRQYEALVDTLAQRVAGSADEARLAELGSRLQAFHTARTALVQARDYGLTQRIHEVYTTQFLPASQALLAALEELTQAQRQSIDAAAIQVANWSWTARLSLLAFGALSLVLGTLLALWLVRSITRPIALAGVTADRVAALDLRHDIAGHEKDEAGRMLNSLAVMQQALRTLVVQVRGSAQNVSSAASEIANGNTDLSSRTEETSASLQQTAAALEQITIRVMQSAQAAHDAQQIVATATTVAHEGGSVVAQVERTMQGIHASAGKIAAIIGVIDSIAFQTNILALNAAVEAAHAGDQGRGFAVVAAEVRSLATRSAAAAREIKALINESVDQVKEGTSLAGVAGTTMQRIVGSIQNAERMMGEITSATQDQNRDIGQINTAVARLDQMTQANSALVEQSMAASAGLRSQAHELSTLISRFVLPGQGAETALPPIGQIAHAHRQQALLANG